METGIIIKPSAWLYDEKKESVTDEIFMGWAAGILEEEENWLKIVTHYGYQGYVKKDRVCRINPIDLCQRDESGQTLFITRAFADVSERPDVRSRIFETLCRGSFLKGLPEISNGYQRVRLFNGKEGYVPCIACAYRKDNDGYLYKDTEDYFLHQNETIIQAEEHMRQSILSNAVRYLGTQYRWAGKSPSGIDCSGLTFMCYLMSGIIIYRDAVIKSGYPIHKITMEQIQPGDLLYFPGHVAIYAGDGKYIHSTGNKKSFGCVRNSLFKKDPDYRKDLAESLLMIGSIW